MSKTRVRWWSSLMDVDEYPEQNTPEDLEYLDAQEAQDALAEQGFYDEPQPLILVWPLAFPNPIGAR